MELVGFAFLGLACLFAGIAGFHVWAFIEGQILVRRHKASISDSKPGRHGAEEAGGLSSGSVISMMERVSADIALKKGARIVPERFAKGKWFEGRKKVAGLEGKISRLGFCETQARLLIAGLIVGAIAGAVFSVPLMFVLAGVGAYLGWRAPRAAVETRIKMRAQEMERHLPEMLDVVALGMRSGLSFDTSLKLYSEHFNTLLSNELSNARQQWSSGLVRRDEALRKVASTYDSKVFERVVETIVRSIRYGSSMVQSLEGDAAEARSAYQSRREERIAKAPVKMLVPTAVLILPAMLIMVLGPVLLELIGGGF